MSLYVGIHLNTQSIEAVVIESDNLEVVWQKSLAFSGFSEGGFIKKDQGRVLASPLVWAEALDKLMEQLSKSGLHLKDIKSISGAAQQHGSVYLANNWALCLKEALPGQNLAPQLKGGLAIKESPIWMDTSTSEECLELKESVPNIQTITGSVATMRFTAAQIRHIQKTQPESYKATKTIHLVSSFMASLMIGKNAPIDDSDASGMNLLELNTGYWHKPLLEATAPNLDRRLPDMVSSSTKIGQIWDYWVKRFGFSPQTKILAFSGDHPASCYGMGLKKSGDLVISLGASDTCFSRMETPLQEEHEGHIFKHVGDGHLGLVCFNNGSLARERLRADLKMTWDEFNESVSQTPPGHRAKLMLPYFTEEVTPLSHRAQVYRFGLHEREPANCRAILESQILSMKLHSSWLGPMQRIFVTGASCENEVILKIVADVFGSAVYSSHSSAGAAFGSALKALHSDEGDSPFQKFPMAHKNFESNLIHHSLYQDLLKVYQSCEDFTLNGGPDPESVISQFQKRTL